MPIIPTIDLAWEAINSIAEEAARDHQIFAAAIDKARAAIEQIGGKDPRPGRRGAVGCDEPAAGVPPESAKAAAGLCLSRKGTTIARLAQAYQDHEKSPYQRAELPHARELPRHVQADCAGSRR